MSAGHPHPGKRTKWFPMNRRPIKPGNYECRRLPRDKVIRTWDGRLWRNPESWLPVLVENYDAWRGLAEKPL